MDEFTQKAASLYQSGKSLAEVAEVMNTSRGYVSRKLRAGGVPPKKNTRITWTDSDREAFIANAHLSDVELTALFPRRTISAIKNRRNAWCEVPEDKKRRTWTDADYQFIKDNASLTDYAIAKALGVTGGSVKSARLRVGEIKKYECRVCSVELTQQGNFCKQHLRVGRQMRSYSSKSMVKGREFQLTQDETYKLLTSNCTYCGSEGGGIDRIDSSKGYVAGNVTPCCKTCNVMKNDLTVEKFEAHIRRIATYLGSK